MYEDFTSWGSGNYKSTLVVVEDSPTQALNLQAVLGPLGVNVIVAVDGQQGLKVIQQVLPDAVVLDVEMPRLNGFEVARRLKELNETKEIPVIMLSRHDNQEAVITALESGVVEFIPKDAFSTAVLLETLRQMGIVQPVDREES